MPDRISLKHALKTQPERFDCSNRSSALHLNETLHQIPPASSLLLIEVFIVVKIFVSDYSMNSEVVGLSH